MNLRLGIGGIVISVTSDSSNLDFEANDDRRRFVTSGRPELILQVHCGPLPKYKLEKTLFDTGIAWNLYQSNGMYVLKDCSTVAILESDLKSGDIYIEPQEWVGRFPLGSRLNEVLVINLLAKGRGIMVHACGVKDNRRGLLFVGTSQTGKSTMANLWKNKEDVIILSDDRVIIRKVDSRFQIYGTPWHGNAKVCSPERTPLEKIFFLNHAKQNSIKKIESLEAASRLIVCSFPTFWDKKGMEFTLRFCAELAKKIPCYEVGFVPDERVLNLIENHR